MTLNDLNNSNAELAILTQDVVVLPTLAVGDSYGGGKVAYILQPGESNGVYNYDANVQHGLIAATEDQGTGIHWWNGIYGTPTEATGTALGTGLANTNKIIVVQGPPAPVPGYPYPSDYAANLARAYNGGGYDDWFLPSKDELDKLHLNKDTIGGFVEWRYWSSSEYNEDSAWFQYFYDYFVPFNFSKANACRVRAVRYF